MSGIDALSWVPSELAREFRFERVLGEDRGMVRVQAHELRLDRPVLLILLNPARREGGIRAEPFLAGLTLLARVNHPGVRAVQQADLSGDVAFAVLEHVAGEPLSDYLARGPLAPGRAVACALELLDALTTSHARGVAHPGLSAATVVRGEARLVIDGVGAMPADAVTERAELEAVARIVYHAVTGRPWDAAVARPFAGVPRSLRATLRRALAADTSARWADQAAFRRALAATGRRSWTIAAGVAVLLAVVAARLLPRPHSMASEPATNEVAVLPLAGDDSLGSAIAQLLTESLRGVEGLDLVSPRLLESWSLKQHGHLEGAQFLESPELRAKWAVHGFVNRTHDSLHVRLTLYPWRGTKTALPQVSGSVKDLPDLAKRLVLPLLTKVARGLEPRLGRLEDLGGLPFEATKSFLQGEAAFDRDAWTSARKYYEAAIAREPTFALARWRLANVRRWEREPYDFFGDIRGIRDMYGERLRKADRDVLEALLEPDLARRLARLRELDSLQRGDAYQRYLYAEELFHRGPLVGYDNKDALRAMERTIEADSTFAEAYNHLFAAQVRAGRQKAAKNYLDLRRRIVTESGDLDKVKFMRLAYDARFVPVLARLEVLKLEHWIDSTDLAGLAQVSRLGAPWFDIPATQVALCHILLEHAATDSARASAHSGIAVGLLTLGRPAAALAHLDSAVGLADSAHSTEASLLRTEWEVIPPLVGLPRWSAPGSRWRQELAHLRLAPMDRGLVARIEWALAAGSLAVGDSAGFRAHADTLEALDPGSPLAVLLRAMDAGARDEPAVALRISDSARAALSVNQPPDPFAGAVYHLFRARWHLAMADDQTAAHRQAADSALRWIDGSDFNGWPMGTVQAGEIDATFGVYARWRRADAALVPGATRRDTAAACHRLRRVVELWAGSDRVMRPLRDSAMTRMKACRP